MHSFLAQTLTILLHFGTGDPLHSIDCEQELFETAFDTNVHVEASVSYPRVPEATPLARYANEAIHKLHEESGIWQGGALNLSQALPAPKQLNLKSLAMQAGLKFSGCPTQPETDCSCSLCI